MERIGTRIAGVVLTTLAGGIDAEEWAGALLARLVELALFIAFSGLRTRLRIGRERRGCPHCVARGGPSAPGSVTAPPDSAPTPTARPG